MDDEVRRMESEIDQLMGEYQELQKNLELMQAEILRVQATAYSEDGLVVVTVGPQGHLLGIRIDPLVNRRPGTDELSASIMEAVHKAVALAQEEVAAITRQYVPDGIDHEQLGSFDISSMVSGFSQRLTDRG